MRKTVIVEFNGLAGLGKTTVANILIDKLNKMGFKTVNRQYSFLLYRILFHYFPKQMYSKLYHLVLEYADTLPKRETKRTHLLFTSAYTLKYKSIMRFSCADFAIIDEALIQFLVAMAFKDRMPHNDKAEAIVQELKRMGISFIRVDCVNHVHQAAERIMSRPPRGLVFESMSNDELIATLKTESYNFDYMRELFSKVYPNQQVIEIDTNESPIENAEKIQKFLLR